MPRNNLSPVDPSAALRIFVVENDNDSRLMLTLLLEQMGHAVVSAVTIDAALAALPASGCNVLISDIGLPDGTGWELLRRLHQEQPLYAIAMSGYGMRSDREKSKTAGFRHHIVKPLEIGKLEDILAEAGRELSAHSVH